MIIMIGLVLILIGLWKKNIISSVLSLLFMLWIITIVPHDIYSNNDYAAYLMAYQNPDSVSMEPGFILMLKILYSTGLSFDQARWTLLFMGTIIFWLMFRWISKSWSLVLIGYLFSTFFIDQVQLRNTIMWAFIFIGICILLKRGMSKINVLLFLAFVFVAGSIQSSGYLYALIALFSKFFVENNTSNKNTFIEGLKSFFITLFLYYAGYYVLTPILNIVQKFLPIHFVEGYLASGAKGGGQVGGLGLAIYPIQLAIIVSVFVLLVREYEKYNDKEPRLNITVLNGMIKFNYFLIPLIAVNFNFFRLLRNEWILLVLLLVYLNKYRKPGYLSTTTFWCSLAVVFSGLWWSSGLVYTNIVSPTITEIVSYIIQN